MYDYGRSRILDSILHKNGTEERRNDFEIDTERLKEGETVKVGTKTTEYILLPETQVCVYGRANIQGQELQFFKPELVGSSKQDIVDAFVMDRFSMFVGQLIFGVGALTSFAFGVKFLSK